MNSLTKGTRRSTWTVAATINGLQQKKIDRYTSVGYEVVADNGYSALLCYYPYARGYVKLVRIEDGKAQKALMLTPKQLKAINDRVEQKRRK